MSIRVLLADDHAVVRDGLRMVLDAESGIEVVAAVSDGRKAVASARKLEPDVAVLDVAMPGLNGIDATSQIRRECPQTKVVILSMYSTAEHIHRALCAGASAYVLKESAGKEVVSAVRAADDDRHYLSQRITETVIADYIRPGHGNTPKSPLMSLSDREREVLQLVVEGKSSAEIAELIFLSPKTVETYRSRLMRKLNISDLPGLVKFAIQHGITSAI